MTIGIYKLEFKGISKVYIGQSSNIERRFIGHKQNMQNGTANKKVQAAYDIAGIPELYILEECSLEELDLKEGRYINLYDSIDNGLNVAEVGNRGLAPMHGTTNPSAKYAVEDYYNVLYFLSEPGYSWKEISSLTGVSEYVISHISSLESHGWLEELFPEEYAKVRHIKNSGGRNYAYMQGIFYPKIRGPDGEVFEVKHQTNFAKEHGLSQSKLCEVLHGNRKSHKGWRLV